MFSRFAPPKGDGKSPRPVLTRRRIGGSRPASTRRRIGDSRRRRGVAAIEMAVILVPMLIVVFGTLNVCQQLHRRQDAIIVAFEGARMRSMRNSTTQESIQFCNQLLADRGVAGGDVRFDFPDGDSSGSHFSVTVTIPSGELNLPFTIAAPPIVVTRHSLID